MAPTWARDSVCLQNATRENGSLRNSAASGHRRAATYHRFTKSGSKNTQRTTGKRACKSASISLIASTIVRLCS